MKTSEQINELAQALVSFQADLKPLTLDREVEVKTRTGGMYKFKYATFANCKEFAQPLLTKHGLSVSQIIDEGGAVSTILIHKSGQYMSGTFCIDTVEKTPQAIGSAISYAKRYAFTSILGLVADDDDDANIAEGNQFKAKDKTFQTVDPVLNEKDWMTKAQRDKLLDKIMKGEYLDKTTEEVIKVAERYYKLRTEFRDDIKEAMDLASVPKENLI